MKKTMTEKSSIVSFIQEENALDCKHFYDYVDVNSPLESASGYR